MKFAPVSADLLIKLALIAGAVGLAVYVVRRSQAAVSGAVDQLVDQAGAVADAVIVGMNPHDPGNWVNQGVSKVGGALVSHEGPGRNGDGSWTVGAWLYDLTHADPVKTLFDPKTEELAADHSKLFIGA